jgi:hypothetical protein
MQPSTSVEFQDCPAAASKQCKHAFEMIRGCDQKFPVWVDNEIYAYNNKHSLRSNTKDYAKLTRLTHKIAIQLHLVAQSCTIYSSRSRRPVQKLLDIPSYTEFHDLIHQARQDVIYPKDDRKHSEPWRFAFRTVGTAKNTEVTFVFPTFVISM